MKVTIEEKTYIILLMADLHQYNFEKTRPGYELTAQLLLETSKYYFKKLYSLQKNRKKHD